jgi:nucleotide-binding universal stress UspA family protein
MLVWHAPPPAPGSRREGDDMYRSVVVGADGSETAKTAVTRAAELAALCGATLHVVTAYKPKALSQAGLPQEFRYSVNGDEADALLAELAAQAQILGAEVLTHAQTSDATAAILDVADEVKADLIVVGNKGMKGARRVLGSIPNSIAHQAPCSVLIVETT